MGLNHPKYNPVPIPYPNPLQSMEKLCLKTGPWLQNGWGPLS